MAKPILVDDQGYPIPDDDEQDPSNDPVPAPPPPPTPPPPAPPGPPPPAPAPTGPYPGYRPYDGPLKPNYNFGSAPSFDFDYPDWVEPAPFAAPTMEEAENEPGYKFTLDQGRRALEQSASAKGAVRTGGTLKDVLTYGQAMGRQNYGQVYDRKATEYDRTRSNLWSTYSSGRDHAFGVAREAYAPRLKEWEVNALANQRAAEMDVEGAWRAYRDEQDRFFRQWEAQYESGQD